MYNDVSLEKYVRNLKRWYRKGYNGAIVMNCNPFTLGHQYLIRETAAKVDNLFVFVVQEDKSYFRFEDRFEMVKAGTKDIDNVIVVPSGTYMISANTLPGYFDKSHLGNIEVSALSDLELFATICNELNISIRFAGTEPKDGFTRSYNKAMEDILPKYGIKFCEIERISIEQGEDSDIVISATTVRNYIDRKQFEIIRNMVPETTYDILQQKGYLI